jgi:hypothetical protein
MVTTRARPALNDEPAPGCGENVMVDEDVNFRVEREDNTPTSRGSMTLQRTTEPSAARSHLRKGPDLVAT